MSHSTSIKSGLPKSATKFIASDNRGNRLYGNAANNQWWYVRDTGGVMSTRVKQTAIVWFAGIKGIKISDAESRWL